MSSDSELAKACRTLVSSGIDYYDLPKDKRWLRPGDTPYSIGGHGTDFEQVAIGLESRLRERYPINEVPEHLVESMRALKAAFAKSAAAFDMFMNLMNEAEAHR